LENVQPQQMYFISFFLSIQGREQKAIYSAETSKRAQCASPGYYTLQSKTPIKEIMTSQELDQHSKIPTTKAKGYILLT